MRYLYVIFIILSAASLSFSQGDKNELNQIGFSFAMGVDEAEKGYEVSLQLINPSALSGEKPIKNSPYVVYKASGKTIDAALEHLSVYMSRHLHLKQMQIIVIGEKMARNRPIHEIANYLLQATDIPANVLVVTTRDATAYEMLKVFAPVEGFSGLEITSILQKLGRKIPQTASDIKIDLMQQGKDLTLPYIYIMGKRKQGEKQANFETLKPTHLAYGGTALFKGEKLKGFIDSRESLYLYMLEKKTSNFLLAASCPKDEKNYFTFKVSGSRPKLRDVKINGDNIRFLFNLKLDGTVSQYNCRHDLGDPETIELLKKELVKDIEHHVEEGMVVFRNYEIDPFGLGVMLEKHSQQEWDTIKARWPALLKTTSISIDADIRIPNIGDFKVGSE
ncbi:Ger(x)C family spore germination protein [Ectobacillus sp. JY-23]|uniref:Ger(x)C family spore germination protein n=1 Tax=Ectobacillus sp. JY-23 TaxID=2933872 RepID=UPI001FF15822|nr:Ger(x)C family spore germination protein [Ectobacillus sp. JY-23]UOY92280.1 Ger(x)C family spore germination protein [Ectobacillus sp. JY-23]